MKLILVITLLSTAACAQHVPLRPVALTPPGSTPAITQTSTQISQEDALRLINSLLQQRLLQATICASVGLQPSCNLDFDSGLATGQVAIQPKK